MKEMRNGLFIFSANLPNTMNRFLNDVRAGNDVRALHTYVFELVECEIEMYYFLKVKIKFYHFYVFTNVN